MSRIDFFSEVEMEALLDQGYSMDEILFGNTNETVVADGPNLELEALANLLLGV